MRSAVHDVSCAHTMSRGECLCDCRLSGQPSTEISPMPTSSITSEPTKEARDAAQAIAQSARSFQCLIDVDVLPMLAAAFDSFAARREAEAIERCAKACEARAADPKLNNMWREAAWRDAADEIRSLPAERKTAT